MNYIMFVIFQVKIIYDIIDIILIMMGVLCSKNKQEAHDTQSKHTEKVIHSYHVVMDTERFNKLQPKEQAFAIIATYRQSKVVRKMNKLNSDVQLGFGEQFIKKNTATLEVLN